MIELRLASASGDQCGLDDDPLAAALLQQAVDEGLGVAPGMIHWLIAGGESGANARPMHPDWARSLRDQCQAAHVAFHFKQWGEYLPTEETEMHPHQDYAFSFGNANKERVVLNGLRAARMERVGKRATELMTPTTPVEIAANLSAAQSAARAALRKNGDASSEEIDAATNALKAAIAEAEVHQQHAAAQAQPQADSQQPA